MVATCPVNIELDPPVWPCFLLQWVAHLKVLGWILQPIAMSTFTVCSTPHPVNFNAAIFASTVCCWEPLISNDCANTGLDVARTDELGAAGKIRCVEIGRMGCSPSSESRHRDRLQNPTQESRLKKVDAYTSSCDATTGTGQTLQRLRCKWLSEATAAHIMCCLGWAMSHDCSRSACSCRLHDGPLQCNSFLSAAKGTSLCSWF